MNRARELQAWAKGFCAWNLPATFKPHVRRVGRNQHGKTIAFDDGSRAFIPRGTADVIASD